jgi:hypothetical protein
MRTHLCISIFFCTFAGAFGKWIAFILFGCSEIYVIKNSQPIVRMAIGLRGLERKSPIIGSQASLQPANILFPLNRDP